MTEGHCVTIKINDIVLTNSKSVDHFIIQHLRIPTMLNYKLPLIKILQLAYNAGHVKSEFEKGTYHKDIAKFYHEHKLSEISTYLPSDVTDKLVSEKQEVC